MTTLIRDAMAVAEGKVPDLDALQDKIEEAEENANGRAGRPRGRGRVHEDPADSLGSPATGP